MKKAEEVLLRHGVADVSMSELSEWAQHFAGHEAVKSHVKSQEALRYEVFEKQAMTPVQFKEATPAKLTPELYLATCSKLYESLRHDLWVSLKQKGSTFTANSKAV